MDGLALLAARGDHARPEGKRAVFGLSLCAGAGGLDLGLHLAVPRYRTICYVERESYAASTLVARMEDAALDKAPVWDDVTSFDGKAWRGVVDIVHGGYPCQPFSVAGRKLGDKDPRHLWPHIARIVREIRPPICFFENVGGHLQLGFEQVHDDLQRMGYRVEAGLFTAAEIGAPHKRERLFILAYREGFFGKRGFTQGDLGWEPKISPRSQRSHVANCDGNGLACSMRQIAGKNDPQGRTKRSSNAEPCGNGSAAEGIPLYEARSGKSKRRRKVSDSKSPMADASRSRAGEHKFGSRDQFDGSQQGMANTARMLRQEIERHEQDGTRGGMGNASIVGLQESRQCFQPVCSKTNFRRKTDQFINDGASDGFPIWPPSPTKHEEWDRISADLKPAVCRMADGMAHRVDRLRLCGNGVVPLVAAYAFCSLATQAIEES